MAKQIHSATFLGPNLGLTTIGSHAYAYSGGHGASTSSVTYLDFTTGDGMFIGQFQFNTPLEQADPTAGIEATCRIDFNGEMVSMLKASSDFNDNANGSVEQGLIIPPNTHVTVLVDCHHDDATRLGTATIIGKII